jgi:hypothetical protein
MLRRVLASVVLLAALVQAADPPKVAYKDDKVTAKLQDAPPADVVDAIAKESGAQIRGEVRSTRPLSMDFQNEPVKQALERVLGDQNFDLIYGTNGKLQRIELRGTRQAAVAKAGVAKTPEEIEAQKREIYHLFFHDQAAIPVAGRVRAMSGKDTMGWDYLVNTAYFDPDPRVRREAVRAALKAFEGDPDLRDGVLATSRNISDADFAAWARAACYMNAEAFVRDIARETDIPEMRTRARTVLRLLRQNPYRGPIPEEFVRAQQARRAAAH